MSRSPTDELSPILINIGRFYHGLPLSEECDQLWVIVDRFSKMFILCHLSRRRKPLNTLQPYLRERSGSYMDCRSKYPRIGIGDLYWNFCNPGPLRQV
jgi:hypothetical protein